MKLTDYEHLESLVTKRGAITVQAADLLAWREEMQALRVANRQLTTASEKLLALHQGLLQKIREINACLAVEA
jgi:hypothetical protein